MYQLLAIMPTVRWMTIAIIIKVTWAQSPVIASQAPSPTPTAIQSTATQSTVWLPKYLLIIIGGLAGLVIGWRVLVDFTRYVRHLACLTNEKQVYFKNPSPRFASFKRSILYAPIFSKRHNREFQLSTAVNMGTLPTRMQLLFLVAYFGTNVAFCVISIDWYQSFDTVAGQLRSRSGVLAVMNMIPLFIMAARNNPLINWLQMSFDTFNLLHRWFGRIVVLESLVHTGAWLAGEIQQNGWPSAVASFSSPLYMFGLIAVVAATAISVQAMSVVRHAFYETFKHIHIALASLFIVGLWYHLKLADISQLNVLIGAVAIWGLERLTRIGRVIFRNVGKGGTKACIEALPGNAVRITVDLARPWDFIPGQHAYLYIPSIGLWTSHPFSVAWSRPVEFPNEKLGLASTTQEVLALRKISMSFIVRARTGFTAQLFKKAEAAPRATLYTKCFVEGPYGGVNLLHSYGTVMLIAGGIGITHQVPHVRDLIAGFANGTVAARRVLLVWIIQSPEHLEWIRPWMTEILAMDKRRDVLRIMLFVSRPRSTKEIHSPSSTVQMFPGRPNIETLLDMEIEHQVGAMGVSVCGSGALSDDVRKAVRNRQHRANIDLHEEAFSW